MLSCADYMDLHQLQREGLSLRAIARRTGHSRNTVRRLLRAPTPPHYHAPQRDSQLDAYKEHLQRRHLEHGLSAVRLLAEIQPMGYAGSVDVVRRFLRTLRAERQRTSQLTVRFETGPGEQAQVDWKHAGSFTTTSAGHTPPTTAPLASTTRPWKSTVAISRNHSALELPLHFLQQPNQSGGGASPLPLRPLPDLLLNLTDPLSNQWGPLQRHGCRRMCAAFFKPWAAGWSRARSRPDPPTR